MVNAYKNVIKVDDSIAIELYNDLIIGLAMYTMMDSHNKEWLIDLISLILLIF